MYGRRTLAGFNRLVAHAAGHHNRKSTNRVSCRTASVLSILVRMMTPKSTIFAQAEELLGELQKEELSIIRLAEPVCSINTPNGAKRNSDLSADASDNPTPASFAADLSHYKVHGVFSNLIASANSLRQELFSKLRFSYLEQVTKEKFLRAIVGDPPSIVEHQDNVELEAQLGLAKADLKAKKQEVAQMTVELEAQGKELSRRKLRSKALIFSTEQVV